MPAAEEPSLELLRSTEDEDFLAVWPTCEPFTSASWQQGLAMFRAVRYLVQARIRGVLVDCSRGDSGLVLVAMRTLILHETRRRFVLVDWEASAEDQTERREQILLAGYDPNLVRRVVGDYQRRLARISIADAALVRIAAETYQQAYFGLAYFYPRLSSGGVALLTAPAGGFVQGQPSDDYFQERGPAPLPRPTSPLWHWIDDRARIAVKCETLPSKGEDASATSAEATPVPEERVEPESAPLTELPPMPSSANSVVESRYDYVPPGWDNPELLPFFPSLIPGNLRRNKWNFLRTEAPHCWRIDDRSPSKSIGVLSLEEATILYQLARLFRGQRGLAIGCHFGWSTAHLVAAGLDVDVLDPALSRPDQWRAVDSSLQQIPTSGSYRLWAGYSPSMVSAVIATHARPWSFVFIDGDHEGDAPRADAEVVAPLLAPTAMVVFHDLVSPYVAAGLAAFQERGWRTAVFNTMQILGIAWRGELEFPRYTPDPTVPPLPPHLAGYKAMD